MIQKQILLNLWIKPLNEVSDTNNLQTLADAYKQDLQVASNKYLEEIGNAANPKTKFITTYNFDDSIIKDNKK